MESPDPLLQFFTITGSLSPEVGHLVDQFQDLAGEIVETVPRNPERTVSLRKLLEARDSVIRAFSFHA